MARVLRDNARHAILRSLSEHAGRKVDSVGGQVVPLVGYWWKDLATSAERSVSPSPAAPEPLPKRFPPKPRRRALPALGPLPPSYQKVITARLRTRRAGLDGAGVANRGREKEPNT